MNNKNKKAIGIVLAVLIAVSVFTAAIPGIASESAEPPEEIQIEDLQRWVYDQGYNYTVGENWITHLSAEDKKALCGYKPLKAPTEPLPENVSFFLDVPKAKAETEKFGSLPSSYDAMALGYVTPVKNQSACGSCWLFGAIADFESDVLINESREFNFSEQEVGDCNIWSSVGGYDFCEGGNALMTTNYFTKKGSADEACHPYAATPQTCQNCPLLKNVNNWRFITGADGESQISTIKNAILNYGPVYSAINASDPGFKSYTGGVYDGTMPEPTNHAIEIIGWDDLLEAWMIKNSWGTDWGASGPYPGCAWVAYGAANLGDSTSAISGYKNPGDVIFFHDECGWMGGCMGCKDPTAYGAVRFIPSQDSNLTAVDFWVVDANMAYEIKIFDTLNAVGDKYTLSNQLGTIQTGTTNEFGYYSIPLDTPVQLVSGNDFIVQVNLTTTEWGYPIPIDYCNDPDLNWATIAISSGESYASCDGSQFDKYGTGGIDIGIRARAEGEVTQPDIWVDPTSFEVTLPPNTSEIYMLKIGNAGNATLTYSIIDDGSWLDEDPKSGSVPPSTYDTITVSINTIGLPVDEYNANINITSNDPDESVVTVPVHLTVRPDEIFDTCPGTYPSIMGTHNGKITPNQTINVSKMYTYPCTGTGGHSEYVAFYYTDTAGTGTVLIIDDDNDVHFGDDQSVDIFNTTFKDMGYDVTIEKSAETSDSTWSDYDIVVWSCGDDLTPIYDRPPNPEYKKMLVDYVTDGGHLILESGHIATWIKRFGDQAMDYELRKKVLHATTDWVYCDVGNLTISTQHPIKTTPNALPDTIGFTPTNPGDDSGDADAVRILPNATGVYNWSSVACRGKPVKESVARISYGLIAYDNDADVTNGGQILYYAFDIDDIDDPDIQRELIKNSENWLRVVKGAEIANGTWTGYQGAGDYHYIVFEKAFELEKDVTYNYTIRTGSYPQIHDTDALPTANGWINCTKFTDANGNEYTDRIPAIRLE